MGGVHRVQVGRSTPGARLTVQTARVILAVGSTTGRPVGWQGIGRQENQPEVTYHGRALLNANPLLPFPGPRLSA